MTDPSTDRVAEITASGPRVRGHRDAVRAALLAVRDGADQHYGPPSVGEARDIALLDGDARYADALAALADAGDLHAIGELGQTIAMLAAARARTDDALEAATWEAAAAGIGWGSDAALSTARSAVRAGDPAAPSALRSAARQLVPNLQTAP